MVYTYIYIYTHIHPRWLAEESQTCSNEQLAGQRLYNALERVVYSVCENIDIRDTDDQVGWLAGVRPRYSIVYCRMLYDNTIYYIRV